MALLSPGDDRYKALALFKTSRYKLVTLVVDVAARQQRVARHFKQPAELTEVELLEGITRQTQPLRQLESHRNLPRFDKVVEGEGGTWLISFFEPGTTLSQYIGAEGTVPLLWVLWWLHEVLSALAALHGLTPPACVGHLEPSDVVVRDERVFVVDMGVFERIFDPVEDRGTHPYAQFMAPERRQSAPASIPGDLYSAAALAFWLMTGFTPVVSDAASSQHMQDALRAYCPDLPPEVVSLLGQMLNLDPGLRPPSALEARRRLSPFSPSQAGQPLPPPNLGSEGLAAAEVTRVIGAVEPPKPLPRARPAALDSPLIPEAAPVGKPPTALWIGGALAVSGAVCLMGGAHLPSPPAPPPSPDLQVQSGDLLSSGATPLAAYAPLPHDVLLHVPHGGPVQLRFGGSSLTLDPDSTLRIAPGPPSLRLLSGGMHVRTANDNLSVDLPRDNAMVVPPDAEAGVDLTVEDGSGGAVSCRRGTVMLSSHSQRESLSPGALVPLLVVRPISGGGDRPPSDAQPPAPNGDPASQNPDR